MALKLENINNLISDDLAKRNDNWTEIDTTFALKADKATTYTKTEVDTSLGLKADKQQEAWIEPTLINGWEAHDLSRKPMYMKDNFGFVHLKGTVKNGSPNLPFFTLPSGYRVENAYQLYPCPYDLGVGRVQGYSIYFGPAGTGTAIHYLDGIVYKGV